MTTVVLGSWALVLVAIAVRWPDRLLAAAILCAPFEGAALVNAGGVGVSPYYFALMLIAARCALVRVDADDVLGPTSRVRSAVLAAIVLLAIGVVGAFALPRLFAGQPVNSPRLDADATAPLAFSTSNLGQCVYLVLNVAFLWYAAQRFATVRIARGAIAATMGAGAIVVAFAVYQFAGAMTGVPYPSDVLYSNDAFVMQHGSEIAGMPRIGSTFTEPAGMAVFLVGFLAFAIVRLGTAGAGRYAWRVLLLLATVAVLMVSTSSTAYLGIAAVGAGAVFGYLVVPIVRGTARARTVVASLAIVAIVVGGAASSAAVRDIVRATVFEKQDSDSFDTRSAADRTAVEIARTTLGLGVGLGSNRASSFGPSMLSTIGVYGTAALAICWFQLVRPARLSDAARDWHRAAAAGLVATVGTKLVSSPDLVTPLMWTLTATLISIHGATATAEVARETPFATAPRGLRLGGSERFA